MKNLEYITICLKSIVIIIILTLGDNVIAQYPSMPFPTFSLDKSSGLPDEYITCIAKDSTGYMWIGTYAGLCRYDGTNIESWLKNDKNNNSLTDNWIISLHFEETRNLLWIGTAKGLVFLDLETYQFSSPQEDNKSSFSISKDWITGILCDNQKDYWIYNMGLHQYHTNTDTWTTYNSGYGTQSNIIVQLIQDNSNQSILWLATMDGYVKFNKHTKSFEGKYNYKSNDIVTQKRLNQLELCIYQHHDGRIFNGALHGGMTIFDPSSGVISLFDPEWIDKPKGSQISYKSIIAVSKNLLCIGSSKGMLWYDTKTNKVINFIASSIYNNKTITPSFKDEHNRIWISSSNGLDIYDPYFSQFEIKEFGRNDISLEPIIVRLVEDNKSKRLLFIENAGAGIYVYDLHTKEYTQTIYKHSIHDPSKQFSTVDLIINDNQEVLLLTKSEIFQLDYEKLKNLSIAPKLNIPPYTSFKQGKNNDLFLISIYDGVYHINYKGDTIGHYGKSCFLKDTWWLSNAIYDSHDRLWVTQLDKGFSILDINNDSCQSIQIEKQDQNSLLRIKHNLWLNDSLLLICGGKHGLGIIQRDHPKNGIIRKFKKGELGLITDKIYCMEHDNNGNIWMLSDIGLLKYEITKDHFTYYSYPSENYKIKSDVNDQFVLKQLSDGRMVFSTKKGLVFFNPKELRTNAEIPIPHINSLSINDSIVNEKELTQKLVLDYDKNFIEFNFSALNYTSPNSNTYKYRLNDIDKQWITTNKLGQIKYAHLNPGSYDFQVMVANNDKIWNKHTAHLKFYIKPPWWKTWWAYTLYSLIVISLFAIWYTNQKRKWSLTLELAIKKEQLLTLNKQKELELLDAIINGEERERIRLSRELHDSVGAMIASIKMYFQTLFRDNPDLNKNDTFLYTKKLIANTYDEIRVISHNLMPMDVIELGIENAIAKLCQIFDTNTTTKYECQFFLEHRELSEEIQLNLYRIIQEIIKNIETHSDAQNVLLQLNIDDEFIHLEVENDGKTFDVDQAFQKSGIGLKNIKARVLYLKGELNIISNNEQGTIVSILIPF